MRIVRAMITLLASAPAGAAQIPFVQPQDSELLPPVAIGASFGSSIDIDGDTAVVGAPTLQAGSPQFGRAWVFQRSGQTWAWTQILQSQPLQLDCRFGDSVGISGDTLVVGGAGFQSHRGAVWVFRRTASVWAFDSVLQASDGQQDDWFGYRCAIDGERVIVGAWLADLPGRTDAGAAYVFERSGAAWNQVAKLTEPAGANVHSSMGVAIQGDTAVMTSWASVQIFGRSTGVWSWKQTIPVAQPDARSVALDQDLLAIGSPFALIGSVFSAGRVDAYRWNAGLWAPEATLTSSLTGQNFCLGYSVAVAGNRIVAGTFSGGASFEFVKSGGLWRETAGLKPTGAFVAGDGKSVAVDGPWTVVGDYTGGSLAFAGDAWVYRTQADVGVGYCYGNTIGAGCPCNNLGAAGKGEGCKNSSGAGARLTAGGSASTAAANLVFTVINLPVQPQVLLAVGLQLDSTPFGDGRLCLGGGLRRFIGVASPTGVATWGPGPLGSVLGNPGDLRRFQVHYRDPGASPCATHTNSSNAVEVTFGP